MLLKATVLFYIADRTQMTGERYFPPLLESLHTCTASPRQRRVTWGQCCGHRARLGLEKQQSQKMPSDSTLPLSV